MSRPPLGPPESGPNPPREPSPPPASQAAHAPRPPLGPSASRAPARAPLGRAGEDAAAAFLAARGYQIVARNIRADRVELDLIVRDATTLVFVEVKARAAAAHGDAALAVDPRKQRRLRRGARAWLAGRPVEANGVRRMRFDVVTCVLVRDGTGSQNATSAPQGARWSIEHWQSAF